MKTTLRNDAVLFSVKGQVVIPRWLRKEYHIEEGTRAIVQATSEGILLKPVTKVRIQRLRGILKRKPSEKPFAQEWAEHKAGEQALEEARYARVAGSR
jgi:AbrB family looped-hinge helix DNA binding protein